MPDTEKSLMSAFLIGVGWVVDFLLVATQGGAVSRTSSVSAFSS
ncbi:hypothetical protein CEV32_1358 [Brucella rhizosphaerae]|uniref:Uncharacterized protein n=1 Tax=Brucella rhizosphaerae TaxID=571254 RepID=A0A256FAH0_9HYPH|nr:hypothetical protein CEV32_1358 [Brucella rhizosphaerae]